MKILVVGAGYVGLVTGVILSELGHNVICIDKDEKKIEKLSNKVSHIYEEELQEYLENNLAHGRLHFINKYNDYSRDAEIVFLAVDTPSQITGEVDTSKVYNALDELVNIINQDALIILKSTVPPGTNKAVAQYLQNLGAKNEVASNPEFLREGSAVADFLQSDRIIIGISNESLKDKFIKIYQKILDKGVPLIVTDPITAELIKYVSNSFLGLKIAFINEMSDLCEVVEGNISDLALGVGLDKRIGKDFLQVGPGFGGSCFPKDINGLLRLVLNSNSNSFLLQAVLEANNLRCKNMVNRIQKIFDNKLKDKNLCILGLTFKAKTDDIRESPAIIIIKLLLEQGAKISAYDPAGRENTRKLDLPINLMPNINEAVKDTDAIIILTEWEEFKDMDCSYAKNNMKTPLMIDFRNIMEAKKMQELGFKYYSLGKKFF